MNCLNCDGEGMQGCVTCGGEGCADCGGTGEELCQSCKGRSGNGNCLDGIRCPVCGSFEPFSIAATGCFVVYDAGVEEVPWNEDSACACINCGLKSTVRKFLDERK